MFKNYISTAFRNLFRNKVFTLINVLGLAIGLAASFLILIYILHELSYDRGFTDSDKIYRIAVKGQMSGDFFEIAVTPAPMASAVKQTFPEVDKSVSVRRMSQEALFSLGEQKFYEEDVYFADSSFFEIFDFPAVVGNLSTALLEPFSMVLTRSVAQKYFGDTNPVGQVLEVNDEFQVKIAAVIEDIPTNTHIKGKIFLSWVSLPKMQPEVHHDNWGSLSFHTYVKLAPNATPEALNPKIDHFIMKNLMAESGATPEDFKSRQMDFRAYLQPVPDIHLHSNLMSELSPNSDISYIYTFSAVAIFILLIACINFMNLTTARSAKRAREVGIRKVMGGYRSQLILQFIGESVILSLIALVFSFIMVELAMPVFSEVVGQQIGREILSDPVMLLVYLLIALVVGVAAGSYPAFYLSSFTPAKVLKGFDASRGSTKSTLRNVLVVVQFAISIFLIIGTGLIYNQLNYLRNKRLGFDKEHVVMIKLRNERLQKKANILVRELQSLPAVKSVAASTMIPGDGSDGTAYIPEGKGDSEPWLIFNAHVDHNYLKAMGMELLMGRGFSNEYSTDTATVVVNETLYKKLGWGDQTLGKKLNTMDGSTGEPFRIIGVVRDFHFESLHDKIEPFLFRLGGERYFNLIVRLNGGDVSGSLSELRDKWTSLEPDFPFEYRFLDQSLDELYSSELRLGRLFIYFAVIAIFIACLGLFGLASYLAEQRTREIGIRKTFGASISGLAFMLTRDFTKWIILANIIAWPLGFYFIDRWLQSFAFRIDISQNWTVFLLAALLSYLIAILTVSFQAFRAASVNPVHSLKYE